ncbi:hypothetical protein BDW59DRAFT_24934 [Aspergillus cavernicola]|uniref:FAD-binding domain-containing protein n=1 Tax=Aspergillus cavernicola TaxID=176166 RepID=A0ABR4HEM7_9EURO
MDEKPLEIAIIGGGIAGVALALGLLRRDINFRLYERGQSLREIGAGIGFTPNAERAMRVVDPRIHKAFKDVAVQNASDWFFWVDAYHHDPTKGDSYEELIYKMYLGERGFEGCHRADFLEGMVDLIPDGNVQFGKKLQSIVDSGDEEPLLLRFEDGTTAEADAVIGCDGIRSRVRQIVLGENHPAARPGYSHKYAFRGLAPMDRAKAALGEEKTSTRHMHLGPDAHALTFPVAGGTLLNIVAFVSDPEEWPYGDRLTGPGTKAEAIKAFAPFGPAIRAIIDLLPETLDKWAVFDTFDNHPPTYVSGRICLAGDAAHASTPHHGAGAGFGIEDTAVLSGVLETVQSTLDVGSSISRAELLRRAFTTYNHIRHDRAQWLVETSRFVGELYQWQHGPDPVEIGREIDWRAHKIWDYDIDDMMRQAADDYRSRLQ